MGKKTAKLSEGGRFQFGVRNHRDDTVGRASGDKAGVDCLEGEAQECHPWLSRNGRQIDVWCTPCSGG